MSKNSHDQGGTRGDVFSEGIVKEYTRAFDDGAVNVKFQIIRLEKQVFVYVGLLDATLDSMSIALPTAQKDPVSTVVLSKHTLDPDSATLSRVGCIKTGMPVLASYNIPPGAVSDAVKNDIFAACFDLISASHVV